MLKTLGLIALISAAIFAASLVGLMIGFSWQPASQEAQQQTSAEHKPEQDNREYDKPFWQKFAHHSLLNLVVMGENRIGKGRG